MQNVFVNFSFFAIAVVYCWIKFFRAVGIKIVFFCFIKGVFDGS